MPVVLTLALVDMRPRAEPASKRLTTSSAPAPTSLGKRSDIHPENGKKRTKPGWIHELDSAAAASCPGQIARLQQPDQ